MHIAKFTFNGFAENTYLLYDETKECVIVDPGCNTPQERALLYEYISAEGLNPVMLFNTHCHIDHVLGNKSICDKYNLPLTSHRGEQQVLSMQPVVSEMYGIDYEQSPEITEFLDEGDFLKFGETSLSVLFTPGHSPASISLYHKESATLIAGDVLFQQSIGRTDLPGGDMDTLLNNIRTKFFVLPDDTVVHPGHGPSTTIGIEKRTNPFLT